MQFSQQPKENNQDSQQPELDANGWPIGFIEATSGSIPDLPEREDQGEYEERLELE